MDINLKKVNEMRYIQSKEGDVLEEKGMAYLAEMVHGRLHLDNELENILRLANVPKVRYRQLTHIWFWVIQLRK